MQKEIEIFAHSKDLVYMGISILESSESLVLSRLASAAKPQNLDVVCGVGPRLGCTLFGSGVRNAFESSEQLPFRRSTQLRDPTTEEYAN